MTLKNDLKQINKLSQKYGEYHDEVIYLVRKLVISCEKGAKSERKNLLKLKLYIDCQEIIKPYISCSINKFDDVNDRLFFEEQYVSIGFEIGLLKTKLGENKETIIEFYFAILIDLGLEKMTLAKKKVTFEQIKEKSEEFQESVIQILEQIAILYDKLQKYNKAATFYIRVLTMKQKRSKDYLQNEYLAREEFKIGIICYNCGRHDEAYHYLSLSNKREAFLFLATRENYISYMAAYKALLDLNTQQKLPDFDSIKLLLSQLLQLIRKFLGEYHEEYGHILYQIGRLELKFKNYENAFSNLEKSLFVKRHLSNINVLDISHTLYFLGQAQEGLGLNTKAIKSYEESLLIPASQHKLTVLCAAASLMHKCKRMEDAIERYQRALHLVTNDDPMSMLIINNMGNVHFENKNYKKAKVFYKKALSLKPKAVSNTDQMLCSNARLNITYNLALIHYQCEDYNDALPLFQEFLQKCSNNYSSIYDSMISYAMNSIGNIYLLKGNYTECLEWYQESLTLKETNFGVNNVALVGTLSNIGSVHFHLEDYKTALQYYTRASQIASASTNENSALDEAIILANIGNVYAKMNSSSSSFSSSSSSTINCKKSMEYYKKALEMKQILIKDDKNEEILITEHNIALMLYKQEKYELAYEKLKLLNTFYQEKYKKVLYHPFCTKVLLDLCMVGFQIESKQQEVDYYYNLIRITLDRSKALRSNPILMDQFICFKNEYENREKQNSKISCFC